MVRRRSVPKRSRPRRTGQGGVPTPNRSLPASDTIRQVERILREPRYESFIKQLSTAARDPKIRHILIGGLMDGQLVDDLVTSNVIIRKTGNLTPIQYEIDLTSTLAWIGTHPENVPHILRGGTLGPEHFGGNPIVTGGGGYIVDGHHRWSQVYLINPEARLRSIDLNVLDPEKALRASQIAIAAMTGEVPVQQVKTGKNLYAMSFEDIEENLPRYLSTEFYEAFYETNPTEFRTREDVHRHILGNIMRMRKNSRPASDIGRELMPQFDAIPGGPEAGTSALEEGKVNRSRPYIKPESAA